jgi:hypothetical protein
MAKTSFFSKGGTSPELLATLDDYLSQIISARDEAAAAAQSALTSTTGNVTAAAASAASAMGSQNACASYASETLNYKNAAEVAATDANEIRTEINSAKTDVLSAKADTIAARDAAEAASTTAVAAKDDTEGYRTEALSARDEAVAAASDAEDFSDSAQSAAIAAINAPRGKTILNGSVDPTSSDGYDGDFWVNTSTMMIFGPRTSGSWGSGTSIVGPEGNQGDPGPKGDKGDQGDPGPAPSWGGITGTLSSQTDLADALGLKAPLTSPDFAGVPTAPVAEADTNTSQLATTSYVIGQASSASPAMNGTVSAGTSLRYARGDHVHPTDTSRAPVASPAFTGVVKLPNGTATAPALTFTGDTNTGLFWVSADVLALVVGGVERLRIDNTGVKVTGAVSATGDVKGFS